VRKLKEEFKTLCKKKRKKEDCEAEILSCWFLTNMAVQWNEYI